MYSVLRKYSVPNRRLDDRLTLLNQDKEGCFALLGLRKEYTWVGDRGSVRRFCGGFETIIKVSSFPTLTVFRTLYPQLLPFRVRLTASLIK